LDARVIVDFSYKMARRGRKLCLEPFLESIEARFPNPGFRPSGEIVFIFRPITVFYP